MPLSEHEQRLLEQMERALYAEDRKFVDNFRGGGTRASRRRRLAASVVGFVLGLVLLLAGVSIKVTGLSIAVGVAGFLLMLASVFLAVTSARAPTTDGSAAPAAGGRPAAAKPRPAKSRRSFMQRLEERWNNRRDGR